MARWRRPGAGEMLQVFLLLEVVAFIVGLLWRPAVLRDDLVSFLITVFLVWRVSRGGRISRIILIIISGLPYIGAVPGVHRFRYGQRAGPSWCGALRPGFCHGACSLAWS
jgi:hypothetical protein